MKLKNLNDFYSHSISRQVINYTIKQGAKIIVLPEYEKEYSRILMSKAGNFSPIHLSTAIREKIKYKARQEGLVVLELQQHNISSTCAACGASLHKKGQNLCLQEWASGKLLPECIPESRIKMHPRISAKRAENKRLKRCFHRYRKL